MAALSYRADLRVARHGEWADSAAAERVDRGPVAATADPAAISPARPAAAPASSPSSRPLLPATRAVLTAFAVLTALAVHQLFVLAPHTDRWFAWTVEPPLTAAFLGAGYGAGMLMVLLALRARAWVDARVPVVTVLVFTALTLVATLMHLERFHLGAAGAVARSAAWIWLAVYVVVPVALTTVVVAQQRAAGTDPADGRRLPVWLGVILGSQGLVMLVVGGALFLAPAAAGPQWPWPLTPLTARMVGAWLLAFAVAAVLALGEGRLSRLRLGAAGYAGFGALQLAALAYYGGAVRWGSAAATGYVLALVTITGAGAAGWRLAALEPRARSLGGLR